MINAVKEKDRGVSEWGREAWLGKAPGDGAIKLGLWDRVEARMGSLSPAIIA